MPNQHMIEKLKPETRILVQTVSDLLYQQYNKFITITSGLRDKSNPFYREGSYHNFGLAVDFCLEDEIIFEWVYYVTQIVKNWSYGAYSVCEFEIVQDFKNQNKNHCHLAIDAGKPLRYFTKTYN